MVLLASSQPVLGLAASIAISSPLAWWCVRISVSVVQPAVQDQTVPLFPEAQAASFDLPVQHRRKPLLRENGRSLDAPYDNAATLTLRRRFSSQFFVRATYTYAKSIFHIKGVLPPI